MALLCKGTVLSFRPKSLYLNWHPAFKVSSLFSPDKGKIGWQSVLLHSTKKNKGESPLLPREQLNTHASTDAEHGSIFKQSFQVRKQLNDGMSAQNGRPGSMPSNTGQTKTTAEPNYRIATVILVIPCLMKLWSNIVGFLRDWKQDASISE